MRVFLLIFFLFLSSRVSAEEFYIFIQKKEQRLNVKERTQRGDIVAYCKVGDCNPTRAENDLFLIIIVDATREEVEIWKDVGLDEEENLMTLRRNKINMDTNVFNQMEKVRKDVFIKKIIDKSITPAPSE